MTYLVKCAVPAGQTRSFTDASGVVHTWQDNLGQAPTWAAGGAIPVLEQQLVSACLAAQANKYGLHIRISVRGTKTDGTFIAVDTTEQNT